MKKFVFLLIASLGLMSLPAYSQETSGRAFPTYRSETNIVYCTVDGRELKLNAFLPEGVTTSGPPFQGR